MCWPSQLWHSSLEFGKQLFQIDGNWNMSSVVQVSSARSSTPVANSLSFKFRNQSHSANPIFLSRFLFLFFFFIFYKALDQEWQQHRCSCPVWFIRGGVSAQRRPPQQVTVSLHWADHRRCGHIHWLCCSVSRWVNHSKACFSHYTHRGLQDLSDFSRFNQIFPFQLFIKKWWTDFFFQKVPTVALRPQFLADPTLHLINYPASFVFSILSRHFCTFNWPCQHASDY